MPEHVLKPKAAKIVLVAGDGLLASSVRARLSEMGAVVESSSGSSGDSLLRHPVFMSADVLVLAADDDDVNVEAVLNARHLRPSTPIVARVFDSALAA